MRQDQRASLLRTEQQGAIAQIDIVLQSHGDQRLLGLTQSGACHLHLQTMVAQACLALAAVGERLADFQRHIGVGLQSVDVHIRVGDACKGSAAFAAQIDAWHSRTRKSGIARLARVNKLLFLSLHKLVGIQRAFHRRSPVVAYAAGRFLRVGGSRARQNEHDEHDEPTEPCHASRTGVLGEARGKRGEKRCHRRVPQSSLTVLPSRAAKASVHSFCAAVSIFTIVSSP